MEYVYRYITIEELALILETQKIRFSRLDKFDDKFEVRHFPGVDFSTHIFATCWTKDEKENIPLWKMYASMEAGVRIQLPVEMFKKHSLNKDTFKDTLFDIMIGEGNSPLAREQTITQNSIVLQKGQQTIFPVPITYDDDYKTIYQNTYTEKDGLKTWDFLGIFGAYKTTYWDFQNEYRFLIYTFPTSEWGNALEGKPIPPDSRDYIDVEINPDVLNNIKVVTSPKCKNGSKAIVRALLKHLSGHTLENSKLEEML